MTDTGDAVFATVFCEELQKNGGSCTDAQRMSNFMQMRIAIVNSLTVEAAHRYESIMREIVPAHHWDNIALDESNVSCTKSPLV